MKSIIEPVGMLIKTRTSCLIQALTVWGALAMTVLCVTGCGDEQQAKSMREEAEELKRMIEGRWEYGDRVAGENVWGYEFLSNGKGIEFGERKNAGNSSRKRDITYAVRGKRVSLTDLEDGSETIFDVVLADKAEMLIRFEGEAEAYTLRKTESGNSGGNGNEGGTSGSGNSGENGGTRPGGETSTEALIAENVSVEAVYDDFRWNFIVTSTLDKALPDAHIDFKVEHGDVDYDFYQVIGANSHVTIKDFTEGEAKKVVMNYPFYYYFFARYMLTGNSDDEAAFRTCEQLLESLITSYRSDSKTGEDDGQSNLQEAQLKEYEQMAKGRYKARIAAGVDGRHYPVANFTM